MRKSKFELRPEIKKIIDGFQERFDELSLDVWGNLEELKKLKEDIDDSVKEVSATTMAIDDFESFTTYFTQAEALKSEIYESIANYAWLAK